MENKRFYDYLKVLVFGFLTLFFLVVGFNDFMDPFGIFNAPKIEGINANKPASGKSRARLAKAHQVRQLKPTTIILGSSRSDVGLDPTHPGWRNEKVYDLSINGSNMYEMVRYFQHAHALKPQKRVLASLDFFQFNIQNKNRPDFEESRLAADFDGVSQSLCIKDYLIVSTSIDTFMAASKTLKGQHLTPVYLKTGSRNSVHKHQKFWAKYGWDNHRSAFIANERRFFSEFYNDFKFSEPDVLSAFDPFRVLLATAHREGVDLRLMISPSHARLYETIQIKGLWKQFEQWKQTLVQMNEEEALKAHKNPFPLWDFSGYNSYTTETVPPVTAKGVEMQWYWESSHYKKELGDRVLDRLLEHNEPGRVVAEDFGVKISSLNIEKHLAHIRQDRLQWRQNHQNDVLEIEEIPSLYRPKNRE